MEEEYEELESYEELHIYPCDELEGFNKLIKVFGDIFVNPTIYDLVSSDEEILEQILKTYEIIDLSPIDNLYDNTNMICFN